MPEKEKHDQQMPSSFSLLADQQAMHIEFIDIVQCSANPERVILNFIQRFPEAIPLPGQNLPEGETARLVARFAFTWPHIKRIRDLLNRIIAQQEKHESD